MLLEIFIGLLILMWAYGALFLVCEPGQRVTNQFEMFSEELQRCDWDELPIEMRRMYLIFLSDTQQPVNIACFFNVICSRETFKKV